jgi:hypothetical protein
MNWQSALYLLGALRDAFPGEHPSLSLDRETCTRLIVMLNPEPRKVYQYFLDSSDFERSTESVIEELKVIHQARKTS